MTLLAEFWQPISLTLMLAGVTTVMLLFVGTPIAWWLARSPVAWKEGVAAVVSLPLVLPPTVLGFYLLISLGPNGPGGWLAGFWGARTLAFSFEGLVIGSIIYSLPFMVQPLRASFEAVGDDTLEAAASLGASPWQRFIRVALPISRAGFLSGSVLSFAHTVGEFGAILMIGGNIPGETQVVSIALYQLVENLEWGKAHALAGALVAFALIVITSMLLFERRLRPEAVVP
jgi:molybdate transport system permease protein